MTKASPSLNPRDHWHAPIAFIKDYQLGQAVLTQMQALEAKKRPYNAEKILHYERIYATAYQAVETRTGSGTLSSIIPANTPEKYAAAQDLYANPPKSMVIVALAGKASRTR